MTSAAPTLGQLVDATVRALGEAGVANPRREALELVAAAVGTAPGDVALYAERTVPPSVGEVLARKTVRRTAGEPLAYVAGRAGFRHLDLLVDRRVLIPRPETEQLVELVLAGASGGHVVDVGTGSGCIALSLAAEGGYASVTGIDRSAGALAVARSNANRLGLEVRWMEGDLLAPVAGERFVAVVANPPYLSALEFDALDASVRDWEPRTALVGGDDGLSLYRRLVEQAAGVVVAGGLLALEVDCSRAARVAALAEAAGWRQVAVIRDLFGRDRFITARQGEAS